jgi:AraC family ethanolamine operon transcriptional activator
MVTCRYDDFDAFADAVTSFDGRILLNNPSRPEWSISHVDLGGVHIQSSLVGSGTIVEGESWDGYAIYLPLSGACRKIINGTEISEHSILVLEPGSDICISSAEEHAWCSIFIPNEVWARAGKPVELLLDGKKGACRVTHPNRELAAQGRALVNDIQVATATCPEFGVTTAAAIAAAEALEFVSLVFGERQNDKFHPIGRPRISRQEIICRSKGLLEEREGEHIQVSDLTARAGVSERTLETVFKEYLGITPTHYLQLRNLWRIRRALRTAEPGEKTVTDILVDNGEYEFGRFAARYRRMYGELPSQTLQAH